MRQLTFQVPRGKGQGIMKMAKQVKAVNLSLTEAQSEDGAIDLVNVHVSNSQVEPLLNKANDFPDLRVTIIPRGVLALHPPSSEADDQVTDVALRSPIEVFLEGLQSIGSWWGFLSYAVLGSVVAWTGLLTNTNFLLIAAMLIAPFAGPAMNLAIATARGDAKLARRSVLRYFSAILLSIGVAALLTWLFDVQHTTNLMTSTSNVSKLAIFLPLCAGLAGGINLIQSERSSLVSGAAVGLLVAASLAPPAVLVGITLVLKRDEMMMSGVFLLLLQLAVINLVAALVFRLRGLSVKGARYDRGQTWIFPLGVGLSGLVLACLLYWQFVDPPNLQRSSLALQTEQLIQQEVNENKGLRFVDVSASFTRSQVKGQHTLLCRLYVQKTSEGQVVNQSIKKDLRRQIRARIEAQGIPAHPLISITIFEADQ